MTLQEFHKLIEKKLNLLKELSDVKGHDYASEQDTLDNFKTLAKIFKLFKVDFTEPTQIALGYQLIKLLRLQNLRTQGKTPKNENFEQNNLDELLYDLLRIALEEESSAE